MFGLKPPQSIFVHADSFLKTVMHLAKEPSDPGFDPACFAALVTNSAFAAELYFKCLIEMETGQSVAKVHNLEHLFLKLSEGRQDEIAKRFDEATAKHPGYDLSNIPSEMSKRIERHPQTFREILTAGAEAFVEWRYLYQDDESTSLFALFPLPDILRTLIVEQKPEWDKFQIKLTRLASALSTSHAQNTQE